MRFLVRCRAIIAAMTGAVAVLAALAPLAPAQAAERLPALAARGDRITVSGLSSGAYLAVQLAVAYSARVAGVGVFAGGPYYCVGINSARAEGVCMQGDPGAEGSIRDAERLASLRLIDPTTNLRSMRAWLLAGALDPNVALPVVQANHAFFAHYHPAGAQFRVEPGLGHGLPTPAEGVACDSSASPFINRCGVERVGEMLAALQPGIAVRTGASGRVLSFEQREFVPGWQRWWSLSSLDPHGFVFVPRQCEQSTRCHVHVALHGCRQGAGAIGVAFVRQAGYNAWAAAHDTIVLYPQARASEPTLLAWWLPFNPNGCWDWWGYTGTDYAVKSAVQARSVMAMVDRLAQPR